MRIHAVGRKPLCGTLLTSSPTIATVGRALASSGLVPFEARILLAHLLGCERAWVVAHAGDALSQEQARAFDALAQRRRDGEPVAYLTGRREFFGLDLEVTPEVLIPRPETETLVELALAQMPAEHALRALDLGTGSGAIALALAHERPRARLVATDVSAPALAVARANAQRLGLSNVEFLRSDWYASIPAAADPAPFNLIASNPPYIAAGDAHLKEGDVRFEPAAALTPGGDGLGAIRAIVAGARARLVPGGWLFVEHGYDQAGPVRELLVAADAMELVAARDLAGVPRVAGGRFI
jgi:release factor glutamine methyltransferase